MDCYEAEEVIDAIDEEIAFFTKQKEGSSEKVFDDLTYAVMILKRIKAKIQQLQIKDFGYSE